MTGNEKLVVGKKSGEKNKKERKKERGHELTADGDKLQEDVKGIRWMDELRTLNASCWSQLTLKHQNITVAGPSLLFWFIQLAGVSMFGGGHAINIFEWGRLFFRVDNTLYMESSKLVLAWGRAGGMGSTASMGWAGQQTKQWRW